MKSYAQISEQLAKVKKARRELIEEALDGRTQQWLADKMDMNSTRLSHCINGLMEFEQAELDKINEILGTDFFLSG